MLCDLWVVRAAKFSETLYSVFLTNLKSHNWAIWKMLNDWQILRKNSLVNVIELFNDRTRKIEELHRRYFKSCFKNHIQNLAKLAFFNDVRFNQAKSAVVKHSSRLHNPGLRVATEKYLSLSCVGSIRVRAMARILCAVSAELGAQAAWCSLFRNLSIGWSE